MNQKMLSKIAASSVRLSSITEKHQIKLETALDKWFRNDVLKAITLPILKQIYHAGVYKDFIELLSNVNDAERIKLLNKLDAFNPRVKTFSARQALAHLENIAQDKVAPQRNPVKKSSTKSNPKNPITRGVLADSKY